MTSQNIAWLRYLPASLRALIESRPNLLKIIDNTGWLFIDRALRVGVGLIVGVWMARYLGPENFGLLNYAIAFIGLFGALASLGLNSVVVRDLVKNRECASSMLGTAFLLQVVGSLVALGLAVTVISFARPDDALAKTLVVILGFVMIFKASDVVKYWFEAKVLSKYAVLVENCIFILVSIVKVGLILLEAPLVAFAWAVFVEGLLTAIGLFIMYAWREGGLSEWRGKYQSAKNLLKDSWPLALSGLAVMVYMRIDQIMLGQMLGNEAVGIYTAAVRISEVWYFIPMIIVSSVFPTIIEAKKNQNEELYYKRFQDIYNLMVLLALIIALTITFLSDWIVIVLFGQDYVEAATILKIHTWASVFAFLGVASGKWYLLEGLSTHLFKRTAMGAVINIILNILLIPEYGLVGAAVATLISFSVAGFLFDVLYEKTRIMFFMKLDAILLRGLYVR